MIGPWYRTYGQVKVVEGIPKGCQYICCFVLKNWAKSLIEIERH